MRRQRYRKARAKMHKYMLWLGICGPAMSPSFLAAVGKKDGNKQVRGARSVRLRRHIKNGGSFPEYSCGFS